MVLHITVGVFGNGRTRNYQHDKYYEIDIEEEDVVLQLSHHFQRWHASAAGGMPPRFQE